MVKASTDNDLAQRIARVLVYRAENWCSYRRQTHLSVISSRNQPPPFAYHWQHKNMFGCSWPRAQREQAVAWAEVALNAGFVVFYGIPKRGVFHDGFHEYITRFVDIEILEAAIKDAVEQTRPSRCSNTS